MSDWMIWLLLAGGMLVLEMFTGTFYLLMIGLGLLGGAVSALAGASRPVQFILAAVLGSIATIMLNNKKRKKSNHAFESDPNVNLDVGQFLNVHHWKKDGDGPYASRVTYRGSMWDVELMENGIPRSGVFVIKEVRGSRLYVTNHSVRDEQTEA